MSVAKSRVYIPDDKNGKPLYGATPSALALARHVETSINTSKVIDLNAETTLLRVYAYSKDVLLKWVDDNSDYCKVDNFDECIPAGLYIDLPVAYKADGTLYTKIQVLSRIADGTVIVVEK